MKLWILRPVAGLPEDDNPWEPWYEKAFGFVIRAETEEDARKIAHGKAGHENNGEFKLSHPSDADNTWKTTTPWMDAKYTSCSELSAEGGAGVLMRDFARG